MLLGVRSQSAPRAAPPPRVIVQAPTLPPILTARAPAPTRQQVQAAAYRAAPPVYTKPVYVPPAPRPTPQPVATPRGVAITAPPKPTVNDLHAAALAGQFHDAGPAGDYGNAAVNAYKQTDNYKQAVLDTFLHQSPYQRQAIVSGALHNTASPEGKMILNYVKQTGGGPTGGANLVPASVYGSVVRSSLPNPTGFEKVLQNAAKDIASYAPGTLEGIWSGLSQEGQAIKAATSGDWPGALKHTETAGKQGFDPYYQLGKAAVTDPSKALQMVEAHPVNTALMFLGAKAALFKGAGAVMRSGLVGGAAEAAASTARKPLSLGTVSEQPTGVPLAEERSYSKDILNKGVQVAREKYIRKVLGQDPNVARPAPRLMPQSMQDAFNVGQEAKLRRVGNEMASVQQTLQRAERGRMIHEANVARPKMKAARNVVTHILQGVVRPNTDVLPSRAADDLASEVERLRNARTQARSQSNQWNKQQVRDLETALRTPGALEQAFAAAEHLRPVINGQDAVLSHHAILTPEQLTAKYFPYAQKHMGAIYDHATGELKVPTGTSPNGVPLYRSLPTDEIQAHLEANNVPDPAYVGHYANKATPRQFYMRYVKSRGTLSQGLRTGEAFRKGGYDHTYDGLTGQMAARAQAVAKAGIHDRLVQRSYLKPRDVVANQVKQEWAKARAQIAKNPDQRAQILAATRKETANIRTGMYTPAEAQAVIHAQPRDDHGNLMPGEVEMQPVAASSQKTIEWVRDLQNPMQLQSVSDIEAQALQRAIDEAKGRTDGVRNVVLAPKVLTDQLTEQFAPGGKIERGVGRWVQQFRNTVLPYSTHWMTQIGTEAVLRSALAGVFSPHYIADAKALYDRLGKTEAGRAAAAEMTGATFYGQHGAMGIYHSPNPLLRTAQNLRGTSDLIAAHKWYTHQVGRLMYSFEHNARMAGLGKLMHDHAAEIRQFGNGWQGALRLQGQIIDQIAHGLETNPALVAKFGRKIDDLFGQYGKYSPRTRAIIQSIAPFLPWYLTATKYVFWQLPVHHPISSALLASLRQTVNQDVADGKKEPLNAYATQAFGTLSPFGVFTPQSPKTKDVAKELVQKGTSVFLPQITGAYNAAITGTDPFGNPLRGPHGVVKALSPAALEQGANALAEGAFPLLTKARQIREGGRPSYGTSNIIVPQPKPGGSPGDLSQILNRTLNPFYSLQRARAAKPRASGGSSGGYGLGKFGSGGGGGGYGLGKFGG